MVTLTKEAADILYDTATKIIIPEDYDEIDDKAFAGNLNIKEIIIPNTVKRIGEGAFSGCTKLAQVAIDEGSEVSFMEKAAEWHGKAPNDKQYELAIAELKAHLAGLEAVYGG